jgi:hypothetical protein
MFNVPLYIVAAGVQSENPMRILRCIQEGTDEMLKPEWAGNGKLKNTVYLVRTLTFVSVSPSTPFW